MAVIILGLFALAMAAGVVGHELAHWIVWRVVGRRPAFGLTTVQPRAGPTHTTPGDRLAAAAPYAVGLSAIVSGLWATTAGVGVWGVVWAVFGAGMVARPSRADLAAIRGDIQWRIETH